MCHPSMSPSILRLRLVITTALLQVPFSQGWLAMESRYRERDSSGRTARITPHDFETTGRLRHLVTLDAGTVDGRYLRPCTLYKQEQHALVAMWKKAATQGLQTKTLSLRTDSLLGSQGRVLIQCWGGVYFGAPKRASSAELFVCGQIVGSITDFFFWRRPWTPRRQSITTPLLVLALEPFFVDDI